MLSLGNLLLLLLLLLSYLLKNTILLFQLGLRIRQAIFLELSGTVIRDHSCSALLHSICNEHSHGLVNLAFTLCVLHKVDVGKLRVLDAHAVVTESANAEESLPPCSFIGKRS